MWAKTLLLAAIVALGSAVAPGFGAVSRAQTVQPDWVIPAQDRRGERRQDILSVREIAAIVRARYGGELVSARVEPGDEPVYLLRWRLPNDEVTDFRVDAVSGQVLG